MPTQTHTPGPWHNNGGRIEAQNAYTNEARVIAIVGAVNKQTPKDTANTRLIAAAPALLAALEAALDCYSNMITDDYGRGLDRPIREQMEQAIAQAKGE